MFRLDRDRLENVMSFFFFDDDDIVVEVVQVVEQAQ